MFPNPITNLQIETIITGQLGANCYLVYSPSSPNTTIIDPGDDATYITRYLKDLDLKPTQIIATHGHFDHIMAALELQLSFNIPFSVHPKDSFLIDNLERSAQRFIGIKSGPPPKINNHLRSGDQITIASQRFEIIHTPGHTPGSVALYNQSNNTAFVGDVIFAGGAIGRYDFSYSDAADLSQSVKKLLSLPPETILYSGHGTKTTVAQEQKHHHPTSL